MNARNQDKIGIILENTDWNERLFCELDERGLPYETINATDNCFRLTTPRDYVLYINRTSPSSYIRGNGPAIRFALSLMHALESKGAKVINGARSFGLETSKVSQHLLLESLGVRTPFTLVFNNFDMIRDELDHLPYPVILKPDTGGSGAFVRKIDSKADFEEFLKKESGLFGPDHLLLVQEFLFAGDGAIRRTEFVDGEFLFAMKVHAKNTFNLCPAEGCERFPVDEQAPPEVRFEHFKDIPADAVAQSREIIRYAQLDIGGVEYIETLNGERYFYDINATSIYRQDICDWSGVNGFAKFVDFVEREYFKELRKKSKAS